MIKLYTDNMLRKVEYNYYSNPDEFSQIFRGLNHEVPTPAKIGRQGEVYYLYYPGNCKPDCFEEDYYLYSVRVDNTLGEVVGRKGYTAGNPLKKSRDYCVVATGVFVGEDKYTLYSAPDGSCLEDDEVLEMSKGLVGYTYSGEDLLYKTEYIKEDV
jgi:hypothetical protein